MNPVANPKTQIYFLKNFSRILAVITCATYLFTSDGMREKMIRCFFAFEKRVFGATMFTFSIGIFRFLSINIIPSF